ncbi:hypothetical protein RSOLAG22IIIB_11177 [Rhizoctonia solani]|uniref:Uncharacterized protein n=1 Tax=Rhizoctonia solani TaxID=456999 RepID=A0A0K6G6Y0_9AGAM|nr:hypothetical protein RSOLAG22IIIB_11177 [Rhizoctonia solani]
MLTALSRAIIAGALLAGSAKAGDHFIISQCRELSYTRIDPLRFPGQPGPHAHNVVGAHFYFPSADQPYRGANTDNWILSNGDPTGLTMHGDFINGWNQDTLEQTLQQCNTPNAPEENLQACAPLAKSLNVDAANNCLSEGNIANEDVGLTAPITTFPGCNPYWGWDTPNKPTCNTPDNVALVQPSGRYTVPDYKLNLPLANGTSSQSVTGPAGGNSTDYYSYTSSSYAYTATSSYSSSSPASTPAAALSVSATQTASSAEVTPTGDVKSENPTSSAAAASYTVSGSDASAPSAVSTSSGVPASSAVPTSSSSYDFGNGSNPTSTQSAGAPALTASSQATSTASTNAPAQNPGAGTQVTSVIISSASYTPSTPSSANYSGTSPTNYSSSTSPANATPAAQNANTLNPGYNNGGKTCRRKSNKGLRARRHREKKRRTIN